MSNFFKKKRARSKLLLKPKAPFRWVFMDIVPSTAPKNLTSDTTFSSYLLTVDGTISMKTHLKGAFGLSVILDLAFLFIEEV